MRDPHPADHDPHGEPDRDEQTAVFFCTSCGDVEVFTAGETCSHCEVHCHGECPTCGFQLWRNAMTGEIECESCYRIVERL